MARSIAFAVVVSLMASTTGIVVFRYFSTRHELEASARHFAGLVCVPLAQVADMYGEVGLNEPLMNRVSHLLLLNQDIDRVEIVRQDGSLAFAATRDEVAVWPSEGSAPTIDDLGLTSILDMGTGDASRVRRDGRSYYRVVVPGGDEGQSFGLSLVALFSYDRVQRQLQRGLIFLGLALALGLVVTEWVAASIARNITRNLGRLQAGVRTIRGGQLGQRVEIDSDDEIAELADAFNDMNETLQRSMDRLRQANTELQALDQIKADLVANVSHELRTPLTALKGFLELLDEGELGDLGAEARRAVTVCRRNVDRLTLRVEELVQLSQMEKEWPQSLETEVIGLIPLLSLAAEVYEGRIRTKRLSFGLDAPESLPPVVGNVEQIERVVINLLDNAVKFTPEGGTISLEVEECDHEGREGVLIRIADSGIGIPPGELVRIFDRFHQVDPTIRRRFGGMGLGLSLVQHIVESHDGFVWAESREGEGATFFVWFPCQPDGLAEGSGDRAEL